MGEETDENTLTQSWTINERPKPPGIGEVMLLVDLRHEYWCRLAT